MMKKQTSPFSGGLKSKETWRQHLYNDKAVMIVAAEVQIAFTGSTGKKAMNATIRSHVQMAD